MNSFSGFKGPVTDVEVFQGTKYPLIFQLVSTDKPYSHIGMAYNQSTSGDSLKIVFNQK
jgi:hypothetical protein